MSNLILNRHLLGSDVPTVTAADLESPSGHASDSQGFSYGGHPAAWATIEQFADTFDPDVYSAETGESLDSEAILTSARATVEAGGDLRAFHLRDLRAALRQLHAAGTLESNAGLVDAILDAIYADVTGGATRPRTGTGPYEPGLGTFGANVPNGGQRRLLFVAREAIDRESLYDKVAGLLLREVATIATGTVVSALYLHPPIYPDGPKGRQAHKFMLLLEPRTETQDDGPLVREYDRLIGLVVDRFADKTEGYSGMFTDNATTLCDQPLEDKR